MDIKYRWKKLFASQWKKNINNLSIKSLSTKKIEPQYETVDDSKGENELRATIKKINQEGFHIINEIHFNQNPIKFRESFYIYDNEKNIDKNINKNIFIFPSKILSAYQIS